MINYSCPEFRGGLFVYHIVLLIPAAFKFIMREIFNIASRLYEPK